MSDKDRHKTTIMKKYLILIFSIFFIVSSISCSDDKDDKSDNENLSGTIWLGWDEEEYVKYTFSFQNETMLSIKGEEYEGYTVVISATYVCNKSKITITTEEGDLLSGTINGSSMILSTWGETLILQKY